VFKIYTQEVGYQVAKVDDWKRKEEKAAIGYVLRGVVETRAKFIT
jgi:hypothetical protein